MIKKYLGYRRDVSHALPAISSVVRSGLTALFSRFLCVGIRVPAPQTSPNKFYRNR